MLVVDASVAAKWYLTDELHADRAGEVFRAHVLGQAELVAPGHIRFEVPSAIRSATRTRPSRLTQAEGRAAIDKFLQLGLRTIDDDPLPLEAYDLSQRSGVAYYDALYGALSQRLGVPLIVADRPFFLRVRPYVDAVWLGSMSVS